MIDNARQLLDDVLAQERAELAPEMSEEDYFEIFCASQILKNYGLSYEELQNGIVDGSRDGGIDSVYAFVNGELVYEDLDCSKFKGGADIELHVIQSKTSGGFSESLLNQLISSTKHLLSLSVDYSKYGQYNDAVKGVLDDFRTTYRKLARLFPDLTIRYYYASKGAGKKMHPNTRLKAEELENTARAMFTDADVRVEFLGAQELLELARRRPQTTHDLQVKKNLSEGKGYLVLTSLTAYADFLMDDGQIKAELFESNVRDFQGASTEVNKEIAETVKNEQAVDFWWMNNGVTILASRATLNGDTVTIENPQIVNGLQTSTQIASHLDPGAGDGRSVMIKIVSSDDEETRDKIIKATNSQNRVAPATLRATDKIQRDIEDALKSEGLFYDRRKNFYRNKGVKPDKIISIPLMAQSVMTMVLGRPDSARARPSTLIKSDDDYKRVFSEHFPLGLYTNAAAMVRRLDLALRGRPDLKAHRTNLRFYGLYWLTMVAAKKTNPKPRDIADIEVGALTEDDLKGAIDGAVARYKQLGANDGVAKGTELRVAVVAEVALALAAAP